MTEAYIKISFPDSKGNLVSEEHTIDHGGNHPPFASISKEALQASSDPFITITHNHERDGNVIIIGTEKIFQIKPGQNLTKKFANATYAVNHS